MAGLKSENQYPAGCAIQENSRKLLNTDCVRVRSGVHCQVIEGVTKTAATDELQSGTTDPLEHVDLPRTVLGQSL